jgi:NAD(P)-dependent dehydrogenase (short-subunit alcohol dehydrogenase family)
MDRTVVVTGAASGIGAATTRYLRERGGQVITCDLHDADVIGDLATGAGRKELVDGVTRLSGGRIDAIVANAGGGPAVTSLSLNFFGTVATLEGLRPLLESSPAPRAVAVSSIAALGPADAGLIGACLAMDEPAAVAAAKAAITAGKGSDLYGAAKQALNRWCRTVAIKPQWADAGIPLNIVALGFIDTPGAAYILSDPKLRAEMGTIVPMHAAYPGRPEQAAAILAWCVSPENSLMTGQIIFVDGGAECFLSEQPSG